MKRVLILGGSAEARELAERLHGRAIVTSSLAGRVANPVLPVGDVRVGGFGGVEGLAQWLIAERIDALVIATHPFAQRITANAVAAATRTGTPHVVIRRPAWRPQADDHWVDVPSLAAAASIAPDYGHRVFLTIGRQGVHEFAQVSDTWFLIRAIDPPTGSLPRHHEMLLERGPFSAGHEREVFARHRIDVLVSKNSGGPMAEAKLQVAREASLAVIMVARPPLPEAANAVATVGDALDWIETR